MKFAKGMILGGMIAAGVMMVYADNNTVDLAKSEVIDLGAEDLHKRLAVINAVIIKRGKVMVENLRKYMNENIWN